MKSAFRSIVAAALAFALAFVATSASADTISYLLTSANLKGFTGPYARVTVDLASSTSATVTFASLSHGGVTYIMGGPAAIDVNVNGPFMVGAVDGSNSLAGFQPGRFHDGATANERGAGPFNLTLGTEGRRHSATEISFVLTATDGNAWTSAAQVLLPNDKGQIAATHVIPCRPEDNGCARSGHGNRSRVFASGATLDPSPLAVTAVPIPPAAWLFASGLLGLILIARRRAKDAELLALPRRYGAPWIV